MKIDPEKLKILEAANFDLDRAKRMAEGLAADELPPPEPVPIIIPEPEPEPAGPILTHAKHPDTVNIAGQVLEALILIDQDKRGLTIPEALSFSGVAPKQWSTLECMDYLRKNGIIELKDTGQVVIRKLTDGTPYGPVIHCPPAKADGYGFGQSQKSFSSTTNVNGVLKEIGK